LSRDDWTTRMIASRGGFARSLSLRSDPHPFLLTDLDGTLLAGEEGLDIETFQRLVRLFADRGGEVVLATARPPHDVVRLLEPIGASCAAICSNGGLHINCRDGQVHEVRCETRLTTAEAALAVGSLRSVAPALGLMLFTSSTHNFEIRVIPGRPPGGDDPEETLLALADQRPRRRFSELSSRLLADLRSVAILAPAAEANGICQRLQRQAPSLQWLRYGETRLPGTPACTWIEACPSSMNKAAAARRLMRRGAFVIVAGNAANDLAMLRMAHLSLCPNDAEADVRLVADQVLDAPGGTPFLKALLHALSSRIPQAALDS
jgi:hydroxymethylpyrimidine pyrophosphatase-like HAD family hydrolase